MMGDGLGAFAFWLGMGLAGLGVTFGPIGHAIGRWIDARSLRGGPAPGEIDSRLAELDQVAQRLAEVEERLDFTERLLAQGRSEARADTPPEPVDAGA